MIRLLPKIRSKISRVAERLGPILPILLTGLGVTLLAWGTCYLLTLFRVVPAIRIRGPFSGDLLWRIGSQWVVVITAFGLGTLVGTWYFAYRPNRETVQEYWTQVPTWLQAASVGLGSAVLLALVLVALRTHWWISAPAVLFFFLIAWPLTAAVVVLHSRCIDDDCSRLTSIQIGYLHARGLESRTMAIIVGLLFAIPGGFVTWLLALRITDWNSPLSAAAVAVLVWMVITVAVYNRYDAQTAELTDLAITDVNRPETRPTTELTIKNKSNEPVDLSLAKVRDTKFDLYRFGVDTNLGPGAICTFNAPEEFRLAPNDDSWELPLGYTLKQGSKTPVILTRTGEMYALQREDTATDNEPAAVDTNDSDVADTGQRRNSSGRRPGTDPSPQD